MYLKNIDKYKKYKLLDYKDFKDDLTLGKGDNKVYLNIIQRFESSLIIENGDYKVVKEVKDYIDVGGSLAITFSEFMYSTNCGVFIVSGMIKDKEVYINVLLYNKDKPKKQIKHLKDINLSTDDELSFKNTLNILNTLDREVSK